MCNHFTEGTATYCLVMPAVSDEVEKFIFRLMRKSKTAENLTKKEKSPAIAVSSHLSVKLFHSLLMYPVQACDWRCPKFYNNLI